MPLLVALLLVHDGRAVRADAPRMVIVQPGYPGSTQDAEAFMSTLTGYLASKAGLQGLAGQYHNQPKSGLRAIERERPAFGMVSLGFYLEHRNALGLRALLRSKPPDRIVIVARGGDVKDAAALKGEPVAGGPLHEKAFLERIVFAGKADVASWDAKPTLQASRALRDLVQKKTHRAVVLTGRDLEALGQLYSGKTLEKVAESDYYPPALVVAFGRAGAKGKDAGSPVDSGKVEKGAEDGVRPGAGESREGKKKEDGGAGKEEKSSGKETERAPGGAGVEPAPGRPLSPEELRKVLSALTGLPGDPEGKEILDVMGAEGFEELPQGWLSEMERKYDAYPEKK